MSHLHKAHITMLWCLLFVAAACGARSTGDSSSTASSSKTTTPMTASADPRAEVEKAMRGRVEAKSYRMRKVLTLSSGYNTTTTYEVVNPDRMHMSTETTVPGRGTGQREVIYIGNESYAKAGDAPWQKGPTGMGDILAQLKDPKLAEALAQKTEVKYLGADTLDGAPMLVYQYTIKDWPGPGKDAVSKMWIGATDGLQHQTESESDVESTLTAGKLTHTKTIITYYDFNADINIAPPI